MRNSLGNMINVRVHDISIYSRDECSGQSLWRQSSNIWSCIRCLPSLFTKVWRILQLLHVITRGMRAGGGGAIAPPTLLCWKCRSLNSLPQHFLWKCCVFNSPPPPNSFCWKNMQIKRNVNIFQDICFNNLIFPWFDSFFDSSQLSGRPVIPVVQTFRICAQPFPAIPRCRVQSWIMECKIYNTGPPEFRDRGKNRGF